MTVTVGEKSSTPQPKPPKRTEVDVDPRIRLGRLFVHAAKLRNDVANAVTAASLTWAVDQVTQLSLVLADPQLRIFRSGEFTKGTRLIYREPGRDELVLRIAKTTIDAGTAGTGQLTVSARSDLAAKLKGRRGPKVIRKASPTDFVRAEVKACGGRLVAQASPSRAQVARDVRKDGDPENGSEVPSSWTTFQRLASELGFVVYEFAGTVYFGKPTWLLEHTGDALQAAIPLPGAPEVWALRAIPTIDESEDANDVVSISGIYLPKQRFEEVVVGGPIRLRGLPPYNDTFLVQTMTMSLLGTDPIELTAGTPVNPVPQPPAKPGGRGGGEYDDGGDGPTQTGTKSALDFVSMAMTASGAAYVFGAEASASDPHPAALDCSELVQWALGRVGIPFVDGSSAQIAACRPISVADGLRTRGALLHMPGHIGISCGDGRSVEARNPSAGVGVFRAADISWTDAGLVPGLRYG